MSRDVSSIPTRGDVESAIMDVMADIRVLTIVLDEASNSSRDDTGAVPMMMVEEETFLAWQRTCNHLTDSIRELERVFYGARS